MAGKAAARVDFQYAKAIAVAPAAFAAARRRPGLPKAGKTATMQARIRHHPILKS
jgi:hypothetical protein